MADTFLSQEEIDALLKDEQGEEEEKAGEGPTNIDLILDFPLKLSVILGETTRSLGEVRKISPGTVIEMDRLVSEPVDILINGKLVAQGEVVVLNENFGIRITRIINPVERVKKLK